MPTSMCLLAEAVLAATPAARSTAATQGTARGAVIRTCGLRPRVRLKRPVDAPRIRRGRRALDTDGIPAEGREHPSEPLLKLKLRVCVPSPKTVRGCPASDCRMNVETARPSLGRIRGPYVLKILTMHVSTPCWPWYPMVSASAYRFASS